MNYLFEVIDKSGRKIHLSKERWSHIKSKHPNVYNTEIIVGTITNPLQTVFIEENIISFYRYFKDIKGPSKYLLVSVKYLNGSGYVITSYFVRNMY